MIAIAFLQQRQRLALIPIKRATARWLRMDLLGMQILCSKENGLIDPLSCGHLSRRQSRLKIF